MTAPKTTEPADRIIFVDWSHEETAVILYRKRSPAGLQAERTVRIREQDLFTVVDAIEDLYRKFPTAEVMLDMTGPGRQLRAAWLNRLGLPNDGSHLG